MSPMSHGENDSHQPEIPSEPIHWGKIIKNKNNRLIACGLMLIILASIDPFIDSLQTFIDAVNGNQYVLSVYDPTKKPFINTTYERRGGQIYRLTPPARLTNLGNISWPAICKNIISEFGPRNLSFHKGIDIACAPLSPIFAMDDGVVIKVKEDNSSKYGKMIVIDHKNGLITKYLHLDEFKVTVGVAVQKDQPIATMGKTGNAQSYHLHFEVVLNGTEINPMENIFSQ